MSRDIRLRKEARQHRASNGNGALPAESQAIPFFRDAPGTGENAADRKAAALAALDACRIISLDNPPQRPPVILSVRGMRVGEAGNLVSLQGKAKSGKSAVVSAILAAAIGGTGDCLGMESPNGDRKAVLHFDSEQSRYDHYDLVSRAVRQRGHLATLPEHFRSFSLLRLDLKTRREAIRAEIERAAELHGGIHLVAIDGIADIAADPNDAETCFALIDELLAMADTYQCVIASVLHENPSTETGKTRGHLGSQLERKCQTPITVEAGADGIVSMFSRPARSCNWPKEDAVYFQYDVAERMHVVVSDPTSKRTAKKIAAKTSKLQELASEVITGPMTSGKLETAIVKKETVCDKTARNRIKEMVALGIIERTENGGFQPIFYDERK